MPAQLPLSALLAEINDALQYKFLGETFWITAEITDVKKMTEKRWCFLKFVEKNNGTIIAEMKAVFWNTSYAHIEQFEHLAKQHFENGLEITCEVRVRFHARYGLDLEVLAIDHSYTLGKIVLEKELTLQRLVSENPDTIQLINGEYSTSNQHIQPTKVLQCIALITAPNSDGLRDFVQELKLNSFGYHFDIELFATTVQGEYAAQNMCTALQTILTNFHNFDVVAIVRGGGSLLDFAAFDNYELAQIVAGFPLPIYTGIGHDSNTSIVDMMARQFKTPTKVAMQLIDHNFNFENELLYYQDKIKNSVDQKLYTAQMKMLQLKQTIKAYSPETILAKGYSIIYKNNKIITNPADINIHDSLDIQLKNQMIQTTVHEKK